MKGITKSRLTAVAIVTGIFAIFGFLAALFLNLPMDLVVVGVPLFGLFVGSFEVFYFQANRGRWLREMHPLKSLVIYDLILVAVGIAIQHINLITRGRIDELPTLYERYPIIIPVFLVLTFVVILIIRAIAFLGGKNLFYLLIGKYHRPVWEKKIFLFLDIKGSTNIVDALGPVKSKLLFGKFMFDASEPITNNGGEIYRYTGDGFVATWNWNVALKCDGVFQAVDDLYEMISHERGEYYESHFGACPDFRIGIHGGEIITSEEGDILRTIGFYGDTINIAARMEAKAKENEIDCVVSSDIASANTELGDRLVDLGEENVRGIDRKIGIFEFKIILDH